MHLITLTFTALALVLAQAAERPAKSASPSGPSTRGREASPALPKLVGKLGLPSAIDFHGNKTFPTEDLRFALAGSSEFLVAAHGAGPFPPYAATVEKLIARGYRDAGFRDVKTSASPSKNGERLAVSIEEGPRFANGEIVIEGIEDPAHVLAALTSSGLGKTPTHAELVSSFVEKRAATGRAEAAKTNPTASASAGAILQCGGGKRVLESGDAKVTIHDPSATVIQAAKVPPDFSIVPADVNVFLNQMIPQQAMPAYWDKNKPFSFSTERLTEAEARAKAALVAQGNLPTRVVATTRIDEERRVVDLLLHIDKPAPTIVGDVRVAGNERNSVEEIVAASGIKKGEVLTPERLRAANRALWNSARFLNFSIALAPRDAERPEVDLTIHVSECPHIQPLSEPLDRAQQALVKAAEWAMTELPRKEVAAHLEWQSGNTVSLSSSPEALALISRFVSDAGLLGFFASGRSALIVAKANQLRATRIIPAGLGTLEMRLDLVTAEGPVKENGQWRSFFFGGGYSSMGAGESIKVSPKVTVAPVTLCVSREPRDFRFSFEGGVLEVREADPNSAEPFLCRIDEATGAILEFSWTRASADVSSTRCVLQSGEAARLHAEFKQVGADAPLDAERASVLEVGIASGIETMLNDFGISVDWSKHGLALRMIEKAAVSLIAQMPDSRESSDSRFRIPMDESKPNPSALMSTLGALYFQMAQDLWPPESWPSKLTREAFYVTAGDTRYTAAVLDEIYRDAQLGPFGSYAAARLLADRLPGVAWTFLQRAKERSSKEDLRRELGLLLTLQGTGKNVLADLISEFQHIDLMSLEAAAKLLGPEFAQEVRAWRMQSDALKRDQPVESLIPVLLRGWDRGGRKSFLAQVDAYIQSTRPDAWVMIASVNGQPISRKWVELLAPHFALHRTLPPRPSPRLSGVSKSSQVLDPFITLQLALQEDQIRGGKESPEMLMAAANEMLDLKALSSVSALTPDDLRTLARQLVAYQTLRSDVASKLKALPKDEVERITKDVVEKANAQLHLRLIRVPVTDSQTAEALRAEIMKAGFASVWQRVNKGWSSAAPSEFESLQRDDLLEALTQRALALKDGETSEIVRAGENLYLLHVVRRGAPAPVLQKSREAALAATEQSRLNQALAEHIEALRMKAQISVVERPPMPTAAPAPTGATRIEGESLTNFAQENLKDVSVMQMGQWGANRWSDGKQMWIDGNAGGWVEFEIHAPRDANYRVVLHATRACNFGTIQCAIDSAVVGAAQDLYGVDVIPSGPRELGNLDLRKGPHKLRLTIVGRNPEATDFDFGFDALDLVPAAPLADRK